MHLKNNWRVAPSNDRPNVDAEWLNATVKIFADENEFKKTNQSKRRLKRAFPGNWRCPFKIGLLTTHCYWSFTKTKGGSGFPQHCIYQQSAYHIKYNIKVIRCWITVRCILLSFQRTLLRIWSLSKSDSSLSLSDFLFSSKRFVINRKRR